MRHHLALVLSLLGASACSSTTPTCREATDCTTGELCVSGECLVACNSNTDCLGNQACEQGVCRQVASAECSSSVDCSNPTQCQQATGAECIAGQCAYVARPQGAMCDDAMACTEGDSCDGAGTCIGLPKVCNAPPASECLSGDTVFRSYNSIGDCDGDTGDCVYGFFDTPCPDCFNSCLSCTIDTDCEVGFFCDATSQCTPQKLAGGVCTGLGARACATGYCDGTLCCTGGDCCNTPANCPSSYTGPAICNNTGPSTDCQGQRTTAACIDNVCASAATDDDSACAGIEVECPNNLASLTCSAQLSQPVPMCPASCIDNDDCAPGFECGDGSCQVVAGAGMSCETSCSDGLKCENGVCCIDPGPECCTTNAHCSNNLACNTATSSCWETCNDFDTSRCDIPTSRYCLSNVCVPKLEPANACTTNSECLSGFCECADAGCTTRQCSAEECGACAFTADGLTCDGVLSSCSAPDLNIFRSVGNNANDLNTSGRTVEISGVSATFSDGLPMNIGVGDVLEYNDGTAWRVAFVHAVVASNSLTVRSANGDTPAPTAAGTAVSIFRAYEDLYNVSVLDENSNIRSEVRDFDTSNNLVARNRTLNVACYADGGPSTGTTFFDWTTSQLRHVRIFTPSEPDEALSSQRHPGTWDTNAFHVVHTPDMYSGTDAFALFNLDIVLEGLQIQINPAMGATGVKAFNTRVFTMSDTIVRGTLATDEGYNGVNVDIPSNGELRFFNNIVYGFTGGSADQACFKAQPFQSAPGVVYNNTFVDCRNAADGDLGSFFLANNIAQGCSVCYPTSPMGGSNNLSSDASAGGMNPIINATVVFSEPGSDDYHLSPSDTAARGAGADLSDDSAQPIVDDIDGDPRPVPPSVGADEPTGS